MCLSSGRSLAGVVLLLVAVGTAAQLHQLHDVIRITSTPSNLTAERPRDEDPPVCTLDMVRGSKQPATLAGSAAAGHSNLLMAAVCENESCASFCPADMLWKAAAGCMDGSRSQAHLDQAGLKAAVQQQQGHDRAASNPVTGQELQQQQQVSAQGSSTEEGLAGAKLLRAVASMWIGLVVLCRPRL